MLPWKYNYNIRNSVDRDLTKDQISLLESEGFARNPETNTWQKWKEIFSTEQWINFLYLREEEQDVSMSRYINNRFYNISYEEPKTSSVPINRYIKSHLVDIEYEKLVSEQEPVYYYSVERHSEKKYDASYIKVTSWFWRFFSFLKRIIGIKEKESLIWYDRLTRLQWLQESWLIQWLNITTLNSWVSRERLSEDDLLHVMNMPWVIVERVSDVQVGEKTVSKTIKEFETIDKSQFDFYKKEYNVTSYKDHYETIDMTHNEMIESGSNFQIQRNNIWTKNEIQIHQWSSEINARDYEKFMVWKTEISRIERIETVDLTDKEFLDLSKTGHVYEISKRDVGFKKENTYVHVEHELPVDEFNEFKKINTIENPREFEKTIKVGDEMVDERKIIETNIKTYIPGVWSNGKNDSLWSRADFTVNITITHMSWFSALEEKYIDYQDIQEEMVRRIEAEHPTAVDIRNRLDGIDWFKVYKK